MKKKIYAVMSCIILMITLLGLTAHAAEKKPK